MVACLLFSRPCRHQCYPVRCSSLVAGMARWRVILFTIAVASKQTGGADEIILGFGLPGTAVATPVAVSFGVGARWTAGRELDAWLGRRRGSTGRSSRYLQGSSRPLARAWRLRGVPEPPARQWPDPIPSREPCPGIARGGDCNGALFHPRIRKLPQPRRS